MEKIKIYVKDALQIWKSASIFVVLWKYARVRCEKFIYKHSETIEHVKN